MTTDAGNNHFFDEFLDDYFAECEEHLTVVRRNILALETFSPPFFKGGPYKRARSLLDELLRCFHSLKGLSSMVGMKNAELLAHQMETYLRDLRSEQIKLTSEGMDALIGGTKMLEQLMAARRTLLPEPDIAQVLDQIAAAIKTEPEGSRSSEIAPQPTETAEANLSAALAIALKPEESQRLSDLLDSGARAWHFEFVPAAERVARGIDVNAIRSRLQSIGQLIHASPRIKSEGQSEGTIVFDFIVASNTDESTFTGWQRDGLTYAPWISLEGEAEGEGERGKGEREKGKGKSEKNSSLLTSHFSLLPFSPSNVVRVDLTRLDELMRIVGELVTTRARLEDNLKRLESSLSPPQRHSLREIHQKMERQLRDMRSSVMRVRLVPIGDIFTRMQFVVRDLTRETQKKVTLELSGQQTEIDKYVVERMMDPLLHLVRNAVSHGIESEDERKAQGKPAQGKLALRASAAGEMVTIEIEDDGRGIDVARAIARARTLGLIEADSSPSASGRMPEAGGIRNEEISPPSPPLTIPGQGKQLISPVDWGQFGSDAPALLDILCAPGFSTREQADLTSGRGVGMAIVKNTVQELGGSLSLETFQGRGARFTIQLPLTLLVTDALIVSVACQTYAVPQSSVLEVLEVQPTAITVFENNEMIVYRGGALPIIRLARLFGLAEAGDLSPLSPPPERCYVLVVGSGLKAVGIAVDRLVGLREIVVRPLTDPLVQVPGIAGATEIGDGRLVLILDSAALIKVSKKSDNY